MGEIFDDELADDEAGVADEIDPVEEAYWRDPVGVTNQVIQAAVAQVGDEAARRIEQSEQLIRAEMVTRNAREATDAMAEKYRDEWDTHKHAVADLIRADGAAGRLPDDAQALAEHLETVFLAHRERSRPSEKQENDEYVKGLLAFADRHRNPWTS